MGICCVKQGAQPRTLWQSRGMGWGERREGHSGGRAHRCTSDSFMLMYGRNQHSMVKQLSSNKLKKKKLLRIQTILPDYSNQNSLEVTQKVADWLRKQDRHTRSQLTNLQSVNLWHRREEYTREKTVPSTSSTGEAGHPHVSKRRCNSTSYHTEIYSKWLKRERESMTPEDCYKRTLGRTFYDVNPRQQKQNHNK